MRVLSCAIQREGRMIGVPIGVVAGVMVGCQIDGG